MKLDEIGKTIKNEELVDVLNNIQYTVNQCYLVVDQHGNPVNDLITMIDQTQYIEVEGNQVTLKQPYFKRYQQFKRDWTLQHYFLLNQLQKSQLCLWPLANSTKMGTALSIRLPEELFTELYQREFKKYQVDYYDFRNQIYLKMAQGFELIQPLLTYLSGTSIVAFQDLNARPHRSYLTQKILDGVKDYVPDFRSLRLYQGTHNAIAKVRIKGDFDKSQGIMALTLSGIDFNPTAQNGISSVFLELLNIFCGYFLMTEGVDNEALQNQIAAARQLDFEIAQASPFKKLVDEQVWRTLIDGVCHFAKENHYGTNIDGIFATIKEKLNDVMETPAARLLRKQGEASNHDFVMDLIANQKSVHLPNDFSHNSYQIMQAAFESGLDYQPVDGLLDIVQVDGHYIQNGLQSDQDQAVVAQLWENKQTAKQLLGDLPIQIQQDWIVTSIDQANQLYKVIEDKAIVIKNALGHTDQNGILYRLAPSKHEFLESVSVMFKQTNQVLIEQVASGSTYQALILNGKVASLIERIPENVVGDGRSKLGDLIKQHHIVLNRNENKTLLMQGLTLDQMIPRGIQTLLRYDSFTGSGFQSLDALDDADQSYLDLLEKIANRLKMRDGFIDVIFENIYQPYTKNHPELAVFLSGHASAEFAPHEEMAVGQKRPVADLIIEQLLK